MRISLAKGIIRKCECCNFNYYERICTKCKVVYTTRNGDSTKYCSPRCGKLDKKLKEETKAKISESLKKTYAKNKRTVLKRKTSLK